ETDRIGPLRARGPRHRSKIGNGAQASARGSKREIGLAPSEGSGAIEARLPAGPRSVPEPSTGSVAGVRVAAFLHAVAIGGLRARVVLVGTVDAVERSAGDAD